VARAPSPADLDLRRSKAKAAGGGAHATLANGNLQSFVVQSAGFSWPESKEIECWFEGALYF
jgi:hypothetical protein